GMRLGPYEITAQIGVGGMGDDPFTAMPVEPIPAPPPGPDRPPPPQHNGPAYWIKMSAEEDGSVSVTNQRNGFARTYGSR
ncbi:MAG: hypothetical protein O7H39_20215, partial [Gammaproteobacteria bacterium]|nr:hypothetical protein [Gammaproteobacteria bacterium]